MKHINLLCLFLHKIPFYIPCSSSQSNSFSFTISYVMSSRFSLNFYIPNVGLKITQKCKDLLYVPFFLFCWKTSCHLLQKLSDNVIADWHTSMSNRHAGLMQLSADYPNALHLNRHFYSQCSCWIPWGCQWQERNQIGLITI